MTNFKKINYYEVKRNLVVRYPRLLDIYDKNLNNGQMIKYSSSTSCLDSYVFHCPECDRRYKSTIQSEIRKLKFEHKNGFCDTCHGSLSTAANINYGYIEDSTARSLVKVENVKKDINVDFICSVHGPFQFRVDKANKHLNAGELICPKCRIVSRSKTAYEFKPELALDLKDGDKHFLREYTYASRQILNWVCHRCGHEWSTPIKSRTLLNRGCEKCNHDIKKFSDVFPNFEKNFSEKNEFPFNQELQYSEKEAIWMCDKGHERVVSFASIHSQLNKNKDNKFPCPVCAGTKKEVGDNSLFDVHPELKEMWDYEENEKEGFNPDTIGTMYNDHPVHLLCRTYKHPFTMRLDRFYEYGKTGREPCPYCDEREAYPNFNDLYSEEKQLVDSEWDYLLNRIAGFKKPDRYLKTSSEQVWWKCKVCGTSYQKEISEKVINEERGITSCYKCAGRMTNTVSLIKK